MMTFRIYQGADGWRWRLVAANRRIVADSGEAYTSKSNALRAIGRIQRGAEWAFVVAEV